MPYVRDKNANTRGAGAIAALDGIGRKGGHAAHASRQLDRARAAAVMGALGKIHMDDRDGPTTGGGGSPTRRPVPTMRPGTITPTTDKYPGMRPRAPQPHRPVPPRPGTMRPPPVVPSRPRPMTPAGPIIPGGRVIVPPRTRVQVGPPPTKPPIPVTTATPTPASVPSSSSSGGGGGGTWTPPSSQAEPDFDMPPAEEATPEVAPEASKKPNLLLFAAIGLGAFLLLRRKGT